MRKRALAFLALVAAGSPAAADVDCTVVTSLARIHAAQTQLADIDTLMTLRADLVRLDGENVAFALRDHPEMVDRQTLVQFAAFTSELMPIASAGGRFALNSVMQRADTQRLFDRTQSALANVGCAGPQVQSENGTVGPTAGTVNNTPTKPQEAVASGQNFIADDLQLWSLFFVVLAGFLGWGIYLLRQHRERKRRRSRRYTLKRDVFYKCDGVRHTGRLLDISCNGAKLQHDGTLSNAHKKKIELRLAGTWVKGRTNWSNNHYVGIEFATRIRLTHVFAIVSGVKKGGDIPHPDTQTAPQGTPPVSQS